MRPHSPPSTPSTTEPAPTDLSRRSLLTGSLGLGVALFVGGCTNAANQNPVPAVSPSDTPSGTGSTAPPAFPVTIANKFGQTVVSTQPQRIACVGLTEQDSVLALGMTPVAVTEWFGKFPYATWPWAKDKLGDAQPKVLDATDGVQIEPVAALAPDLILGTNAGLDQNIYSKLSQIAPTIAQSGKYTDYFEPWKVQATAIGQALGKPAEMQELITGVDDTYATARSAHPEFEGKNVFLLADDFYRGSMYVYQEGLSTQFLLDLGLKIPPVVKKYATDASTAFIPKEDLVDVTEVGDVVIWLTLDDDANRKKLLADPIVKRMRSTKEGLNIFTGLVLGGAMNFTTVLSLPYVAESLVPQLADILA